MRAVRIPDPNPARSGDVYVAVDVDTHAVGNTASALFFGEQPAVLQFAVCRYIVDPNLTLLGIVDVEPLSVRRKGQSVRLDEIARQEADGTVVAEPEHALVRQFLAVAFR